MKKSINILLISAALLIVAASCKEWVTPQPMPIKTNSIQSTNPELYDQYCQAVRNYKKGDHKLMYISFDNSTENPVNGSQTFHYLPDSVDIVELIHPVMYDWTRQEMDELKAKFNTRFVIRVSYEKFRCDLNGKTRPKADVVADYLEEAEKVLAFARQNDLDGITFEYEGKYQEHLTDSELKTLRKDQDEVMEPIVEWLERNDKKLFYFSGTPSKLLSDKDGGENYRDIAVNATAIILPTISSLAVYDVEYIYRQVVEPLDGVHNEFEDCPMLVETATLPLVEGDAVTGQYYEGAAIPLAADWVGTDTENNKAGLVILNAERDWNMGNNPYPVIHKAIKTMNPNS